MAQLAHRQYDAHSEVTDILGPIGMGLQDVTVQVYRQDPNQGGTAGAYELQGSKDGVAFWKAGTFGLGTHSFTTNAPFIRVVPTAIPYGGADEIDVFENGAPLAPIVAATAGLENVMSDHGDLQYCNDTTTTGPDGVQPHYLDDAPLAAVNGMGYVADPSRTNKPVYFFVDDFMSDERAAQCGSGDIIETRRYYLKSLGSSVAASISAYSYISGAMLLNAGANGGNALDSAVLFQANRSFLYWPGRRLWFSCRLASVYGTHNFGGVGLISTSSDPTGGPHVDNAQVADWYNLNALIAPPSNDPYASSSDASGSMDAGTHSYKYTFVTANGETTPSNASNTITADGSNNNWGLSIPLGPTGVIARKIYRTAAGNAVTGPWKLLATTDDNTTLQVPPDGAPDSALGTDEPPLTNTATAVSIVGGLYFHKNADEPDWSFIACGFDDGNPVYTRRTGLVNLAFGHDLEEGIYVDLAFRVNERGDVHLYVNGRGVGVIDNRDPALQQLASNDGLAGLLGRRGFVAGVAAIIDNIPAALAIDHVMIAEEAAFLEEN